MLSGKHNPNNVPDLNNEPPTEMQLLQMKINTTTDESLESTRRMLNLCEEAKEAGISTLVMLDDQGEQLDRLEEGMDKINEDLKDAEKNLEDLNKCCGLFTLPWKKIKRSLGKSDPNTELNGNSDGPRVAMDCGNQGPQGGYITKITNDARETEMDQNLVEVNGVIGNLRNMAIDMGAEISQQTKQIDRITKEASDNRNRIIDASEKTSKLLHN